MGLIWSESNLSLEDSQKMYLTLNLGLVNNSFHITLTMSLEFDVE